MALSELTQDQINARIATGDLVVYLKEEYGFRHWYWFPNMTATELLTYWDSLTVGDHFFNPSGLSGDMVLMPYEFTTNEDYDAQFKLSEQDPRVNAVIDLEPDATKEEYDVAFQEFSDWQMKFFPVEGTWFMGFNNPNAWRGHIHEEDDSYLKKPGA